jgi:SAM-dependent methyltransferase
VDPDARRYDAWFESRWGAYAFEIERRALLHALGDIRGATLVDVGCGSGRFTDAFERAGARALGVDLDAGMLAVARQRIGGPVVLADAHRLPFGNESFDVAAAVTLLEFAAEPRRVVEEMGRATKKGGRIALAALNRASPWGIVHRRRFQNGIWKHARFLSRSELSSLASSAGSPRLRASLYAPGWFPGLRIIGPVLASIGRIVPRAGAFQVVVVERR